MDSPEGGGGYPKDTPQQTEKDLQDLKDINKKMDSDEPIFSSSLKEATDGAKAEKGRGIFSKLFRREQSTPSNDIPDADILAKQYGLNAKQTSELRAAGLREGDAQVIAAQWSKQNERVANITGNGEFDKTKLNNIVPAMESMTSSVKNEMPKGVQAQVSEDLLEYKAVNTRNKMMEPGIQILDKTAAPSRVTENSQTNVPSVSVESPLPFDELPKTKAEKDVEDWKSAPLPFDELPSEKKVESSRANKIIEFIPDIVDLPVEYKKEGNKILLDPTEDWDTILLMRQFPDRYKGLKKDSAGNMWEITVNDSSRSKEVNKQGIRVRDQYGSSIDTFVDRSVSLKRQGKDNELRYIQIENGDWYRGELTKDEDERLLVDYKLAPKEEVDNLVRLISPTSSTNTETIAVEQSAA